MADAAALWFSSPILGFIALALALAAIAVAKFRRVSPPALSGGLFVGGVVLLALAAFGPEWNHPNPGNIVVMVDLSPSTRGAHFRDPAYLQQRLTQLIGGAPHQLVAFAADNRPLDPAGPFTEIPVDQTVFSPPAADAVVLFSDGRFDLPAQCSPTYIVLDDGIENVADASVRDLGFRGQTLVATLSNSGPSRTAKFPDGTVPVAAGNFIISRPTSSAPVNATVALNPGDLWPENDSMSIDVAPRNASELWWLGSIPPDNHWRIFAPENLPDEPEQYLAPAAIVIDNQPADAFSAPAMLGLEQYARDLGGSILILGGDRAFGAGGYDGTVLDQISPLASSPPTPTTRWILLADGSGSMAGNAGDGKSRWQDVTEAIVNLLPLLPPADPVQIGQFSDTVHWWLPPQSAADAAKIPLPPADAIPHGPTNLESSLSQIADDSDATLPTQLLLLSDCDATIQNPTELTRRLSARKIALNVLAIGQGTALEAIRQICTATGGSIIEQSNPRQWIESTRKLCQAAMPSRLQHEPLNAHFIAGPKSGATQILSLWNRAWLKPQATLWAESDAQPNIPLAASWHVGLGSVAAAAFEPDASTIQSIVTAIAAKPRDPRFSVQWQTRCIVVDARDNGSFLNELRISLDLIANSTVNSIPLSQTAPGRYEAKIDYSPQPRMAILRLNSHILDRSVIPGSYPPEFDALGNDHDAMEKLAESTGGQVILPNDSGPIDFHWPTKQTPLAPWLCVAAFLAIAAALVNWRIKLARPDAY